MQVKEGLFLALLVATLLMVASYTITLGLTNFSSYNKAWDSPSKKLQPSTADDGGREGSEVSSNSLDKYQKNRDNVGFFPTRLTNANSYKLHQTKKCQTRKNVDRLLFFSQRSPKTDYLALL